MALGGQTLVSVSGLIVSNATLAATFAHSKVALQVGA
jgi:hypothetical protein